MSQAHYVLCFQAPLSCSANAVVRVTLSTRFSAEATPMCLGCLDKALDLYDRFPIFEPTKLEWIWDAGTRTCPLHHWPDVVCADWGAEHAAMLRAMWLAPAGRTLVEPPTPDLGSLSRG